MKIFDWKEEINEKELQEVIDVLDNDGVIIFPTDTVYGLSVNCFSEEAIKKIFDIKNRPSYKPINVLTDSIKKIKMVTNEVSNMELELIGKYMPGALTIILEKNDNVPNILTADLDTIGVRIPSNEIALTILENYNYPLATTSVNISGEKEGINIEDFIEEFKDKVDIIIDGGETPLKIASTIIKLNNNEIEVLRQGSIEIEE